MPTTTSPRLPTLIACGGYTTPHGTATGVSLLSTGPDGLEPLRVPATVAEIHSPSFLAAHPTLPIIYAAEEYVETVRALHRDGEDGPLRESGETWPAGAAACHIGVDPAGTFLVVSCWGDGQVITYGLDASGAIVSRFVAASAVDSLSVAGSARQSRAHAALFLPDGRIVTTDLGLDLARVWRRGDAAAHELVLEYELALPAGSCPRHLVQHPNGTIYVIGEYSIEVSVLASGADGRLAVVHRAPALLDGAREGDAAAEISLNAAATRLYVSVRGSNRIGTLAVSEDGLSVSAVAEVDCGGDWPRHHLLLEGADGESSLLVANQLSDTVATLEIDPETGAAGRLLGTIPMGAPTCLIELRR